jgi:hypothetical protein
MNVLLLSLSNIGLEYIYFLETKKNILMEGFFSKILFFHPSFSLNGLYIHLPIEIQNIENYHYNKTTIYFSVSHHSYLLHQIDLLEKNILDKYVPVDMNIPKVFSVIQTLKSGYFRIYRDSTDSTYFRKKESKRNGFVLKISGIWENAKGYGISYKIMESFESFDI